MKRIILGALLAAGLVLLGSENAFAQRHPGWPSGPLNAGSAPVERAPSIRSERPLEHPFYGTDRGNDNDWRYSYNDNRWWYWTPLGAWAYWNDGRWQDYSTAVPYTTNYRGPTAPTGWYWNNDQKRYYWFDGTTLTAAQQ